MPTENRTISRFVALFWRLVAKLLARQALIARAQHTPYLHIRSADGTEMYMGRWWLFNPLLAQVAQTGAVVVPVVVPHQPHHAAG